MNEILEQPLNLKPTDCLSSAGREKIRYNKAVRLLGGRLADYRDDLQELSENNPIVLVDGKKYRYCCGPLIHRVTVSQEEDGAIVIAAYSNDQVFQICKERAFVDDYFFTVRANSYQLRVVDSQIQSVWAGFRFGHENHRNSTSPDYININDRDTLQPELLSVDELGEKTAVINQLVKCFQ